MDGTLCGNPISRGQKFSIIIFAPYYSIYSVVFGYSPVAEPSYFTRTRTAANDRNRNAFGSEASGTVGTQESSLAKAG